MKKLFHSCVAAFGMYSSIPMPRISWENGALEYMMAFFPLVGVVIGGAEYGWLLLAHHLQLGAFFTAAVAAAIPAFLSGGIHLDGFCDTMDALASKAPPERMLEILKDSRAGAFAVIGCCVYFLLYAGAMSELAAAPAAFLPVALGFALSRSLSGLSVVCFHKAKKDGLVRTFSQEAKKKRVMAALAVWAVVCTAALLLISLPVGAGVLLASGGSFWYYKSMAYRKFGGTTGDLAGWYLQVCELLQAIVTVIIVRVVL